MDQNQWPYLTDVNTNMPFDDSVFKARKKRKKWWANLVLSIILGSFLVAVVVTLLVAIVIQPIIGFWVFGLALLIVALNWAMENA